jgi:hypothetical protein
VFFFLTKAIQHEVFTVMIVIIIITQIIFIHSCNTQ